MNPGEREMMWEDAGYVGACFKPCETVVDVVVDGLDAG